MPTIHLTTFIQAPASRVFDLSRSIDFHVLTQTYANERAIDGITTGLINLNETVTWQARHLFKERRMVSKISAMQPFHFFEDTMLTGDFKSLRHGHHFKQVANGTILIDLFTFETPYGWLGRFIENLFLKSYMEKLLIKRNDMLKYYAETEKWKQVLQSAVNV